MDVGDIAPAILAVRDLLQEANRILNGDRAHVVVEVRAVNSGSFEVLFSALVELLKNDIPWDEIKTADFVLRRLRSVIESFRRRRDRASEDSLATDQDVKRLRDSDKLRRELRRLARPLRKPGIESLQITGEGETIERITSEDWYTWTDTLTERVVEEFEGIYRVDKLSFAPPVTGRWTWTFTDEDRNLTFNASIADWQFRERLAARALSFTSGDRLRMRILRRITRDGKNLYTVLEVMPPYPVVPTPAGE